MAIRRQGVARLQALELLCPARGGASPRICWKLEQRSSARLAGHRVVHMPHHRLSEGDLRFREDFEACAVPLSSFDHPAHIRLAYAYLTECEPDEAVAKMRDALLRYLQHNGVPLEKYHETLTRAWIYAVRHFMDKSGSDSAEDFMVLHPALLDSKVMLTHYS